MNASFLTNLVVWYVVFLFSVTLHEAMHSYAAAWGGDSTAYMAGQATLNPIPHMQREKFGTIVVPLLSFFVNDGTWMVGWASAPYSPIWAARFPKRSFIMSLAGPFSHVPAIIISFIVMYIGLRTGFFTYPAGDMFPVSMGTHSPLSYALALFFNTVFKLNTVLFVFNLMPIPPLDGSEVWYLFVEKEEKRLRWRYVSRDYAIAGLLLSWHFFPEIYNPVLGFLLRSLYTW